ncbi:CHD3-type chromatin-remodeling factor PICKLE [Arachis hypogaea]|uniref:CHD3-type chromatin-remodeling factor PICKLE n=1 Tax=Arachis hypogaea TaxID=3818 RepID=A0A6B9VAB7_ARAHY|nr:CHD3-type chromatin-remodeling factor PICKLE [Arachis hypogaea]
MASVNTSNEDFVAIRPEWTIVYRDVDDEKEYHVKWKELPYDECYWEFETDISAFQLEIERFNKFRSRSSKLASMKQRSSVKDDVESKNYNM